MTSNQPDFLTSDFISEHNRGLEARLDADYHALADHLARRGIDADAIKKQTAAFEVAIPSWGVGTGGTRFARFPGLAEPRHIFDKLEDCALIHKLVCCTPRVSTHFPWDEVDDMLAVRDYGRQLGIGFDAVNSNTFQDQDGQPLSYQFGSLTHTNKKVRAQAIELNLKCIRYGELLGAKALTLWIGDGSNFPGQQHLAQALTRYLQSAGKIYAALPPDWRLLIEHKPHEPSFYATVIQDWGTSILAAMHLGDKAQCLVDLGHHAPNVNIEMIVARLIQFGKLGGFHFNDSKYGDDDLDTGAIDPWQLFLIFHELTDATRRNSKPFNPSYMLDQSHNVTDPIESLAISATEAQRALVRALLVDEDALAAAQQDNDAIVCLQLLKEAFNTDVSALLAKCRQESGGAIAPLATYRQLNYRQQMTKRRQQSGGSRSGIV